MGRALELEFMLPGDPLTATGGYEYDRRMSEGLSQLGWVVRVHRLDSSFPTPSEQALHEAQRQLAALPPQALVLIDGLALGAMPELVHAHAQRLRLVGLVHHPLAAETGLAPQLSAQLARSERDALQAVRLVVVTSRATREVLADYGVAADRIAVVEPGVDGRQRQVPDRVGVPLDPASPVRILCVATVTARKGHDLLVDALAELRDRNWTLQCVGDLQRSPATASALRARIAAARLEHRIKLTGELDAAALHQAFGLADVFVLATRFEGYGMAVAQALAYGLPVISTRTGAIADMVTADAGLLVEPGDGAALRAALERTLSDRILLRRLAAGARAAGARLRSWNLASQQLAEVLSGVAQMNPSTP